MARALKKKLLLSLVALVVISGLFTLGKYKGLCSVDEFQEQVSSSSKDDTKAGIMNMISNIKVYLVRP